MTGKRPFIVTLFLKWLSTIAICSLALSATADGWTLSDSEFSPGELPTEDLLGETVSVEALDANIESALTAARKTGDASALLKQLDVIIRKIDLLPSLDIFEKFTDALLTCGRAGDMASRTPLLLKYAGIEMNPSATAKFNLGIKMALCFGGAGFNDLRYLTRIRGVDLDWLLPALGKTGRENALPLIKSYDTNNSLGRAVALGSAYAGDTNALQIVLDIQDRDILNLKGSNKSTLYHLLIGQQRQAEGTRIEAARCRRRIHQVEELFDSLGDLARAFMIKSAIIHASPAAMQYLFETMESIPADQLSGFIELIEHPEPFTKEFVVQHLWDSGDVDLRNDLLERLRGMSTAPGGYDRLMAITLLCRMSPNEGFDLLKDAVARESNAAVRIALENLQTAN